MPHWSVIPSMPEQQEARSLLLSLMQPGVQTPRLTVPGMTPTEEEGQSLLLKILRGGAFADPATSPYYQGMRREMIGEEERGVTSMRRGQQAAGMYYSTPGAGIEARYRGQMAGQRGTLLGALYEGERARDNPYTRLGAVAQYGALPRLVEGAQERANYQNLLYQLLFPYQAQVPLAGSLLSETRLMGEQREGSMQTQDYLKLLGQLGQAAAGGIAGGGGAAGLGGMSSPGVSPTGVAQWTP